MDPSDPTDLSLENPVLEEIPISLKNFFLLSRGRPQKRRTNHSIPDEIWRSPKMGTQRTRASLWHAQLSRQSRTGFHVRHFANIGGFKRHSRAVHRRLSFRHRSSRSREPVWNLRWLPVRARVIVQPTLLRLVFSGTTMKSSRATAPSVQLRVGELVPPVPPPIEGAEFEVEVRWWDRGGRA